MDTSDLKSAIRVAQSACRSAEKEAVWAKTALTENPDQHEEIDTIIDTIAQAAGALQDALYRAEKAES